MEYLPTGEWMQRADSYTIHEIGIPSLVLMERAALSVVEAMEQDGADLTKTLVVCGSGNNGGDGFAVARLLKGKGCQVTAVFVGREESMSEECRLQMRIADKSEVPIVTTIEAGEYTSIVDAVFGVGLNREVSGRYCSIIEAMNALQGHKTAVDIPSGICSATGQVLGIAFKADLTVAFACAKLGCILYPGYLSAGKVVTKDIGISGHIFEQETGVCFRYHKADLQRLLPRRKADSHKGTYGRVLMVTGSPGMSGAAYLSAMAAYTCGSGLVQIYTSEDNRVILQQQLPEAILATYREYEEERFKSLLSWADVVCIGCGLGQSKTAEKLLAQTLREAKVPCVVDADGLNLLSRHLELLEKKECPLVLTPHMKEMARLLDCPVRELKDQRLTRIKEFTGRYDIVCALKDARTFVMKAGEHPFVNTAGNNAMAKAGSGDVLAGVITALLAQGMETFEAASCGVFLHACGGDAARKAKGSYSVLAQDLIAGIQACIKETEESMEDETIQQGICQD